MSATGISYKSLQSLWRFENPQWLMKRELEWESVLELLYTELEEAETKTHREYFIEGKGANHLFGLSKIFLAPIESAEDARAVFFSEYFTRGDRVDLLTKYFVLYSDAKQLPWYRTHCKFIGEGVFGKDYGVLSHEISEKDGEVPFDEPSFILSVFLTSIRKVLQGRREFSGYIYLIEFFASVVPLVKRDQIKLSKEITRVFEDVDYVLGSPHSTETMRCVASQLHAMKGNYANKIVDDKDKILSYINPRREIFGGWFIVGAEVSGLRCDSKGYSSEGEMKDWLAGLCEKCSHADSVSDMGGEYVQKTDFLIFYYESANWLNMSMQLYRSGTPREYYAFHLGDESDFHLFSVNPGRECNYIRFYLDDHKDTPIEYRQYFKKACDQWFLDIPQEFASFDRTKEFFNKVRMVLNQRSFKSF